MASVLTLSTTKRPSPAELGPGCQYDQGLARGVFLFTENISNIRSLLLAAGCHISPAHPYMYMFWEPQNAHNSVVVIDPY